MRSAQATKGCNHTKTRLIQQYAILGTTPITDKDLRRITRALNKEANMPITITTGVSKKIGLPSYGSLRATCSVSFEAGNGTNISIELPVTLRDEEG